MSEFVDWKALKAYWAEAAARREYSLFTTVKRITKMEPIKRGSGWTNR